MVERQVHAAVDVLRRPFARSADIQHQRRFRATQLVDERQRAGPPATRSVTSIESSVLAVSEMPCVESQTRTFSAHSHQNQCKWDLHESDSTALESWCREGELNPQGTKYRRILSSQASSDPFGKFSTLFDFSTGYKANVLIRSDSTCSVLSMELLQFYYSRGEFRPHNLPTPRTLFGPKTRALAE
jgi:hypothetical protein